MSLRHLVLFRLRPGADAEHAVALLRPLGDLPGITSWRVELSLDDRKGPVVVEDSTFTDAAALQAFREHPRHAEVSAWYAEHADWLVGDYLLPD
jgi:hypothetical protein